MNRVSLSIFVIVILGISAEASTVAYWTFDEGSAGQRVSASTDNVVLDISGNGNHMRSQSNSRAPLYSPEVAYEYYPAQPESPNLSLDFRDGNRDIYTQNKPINSYKFGPQGSNAWTVEFSMRVSSAAGIQRWFGRDGTGSGPGCLQFVTVPQSGGRFDLRIEIFDGQGQFRDVITERHFNPGQWLNVVATGTDSTLRLYVNDGSGFELMGRRTDLNGALNDNVSANWSIGRGWFGNPNNWISGHIGAVRVSDRQLNPQEFLWLVGPTVTSQPQSRSLFQGGQAQFSVETDSPDTLVYHWFRADTPQINPAGDTAMGQQGPTLDILDVAPEHQGFYYCRISNPARAQSIYSDPARLMVSKVIYGGAAEDGWRHWPDQTLYALNAAGDETHLQRVAFMPSQAGIRFEPLSGRLGTVTAEMNYSQKPEDVALEQIAGTLFIDRTGIYFNIDRLAPGEEYEIDLVFAVGQQISRSLRVFLFESSSPAMTVDVAGSDVNGEGPAPTYIVSLAVTADSNGTIWGDIIPYDNTDQGGYPARSALLNGLVVRGEKLLNNPVMEGADPDILLVDDTVYVYTTWGYHRHFYAFSSKDLVEWQLHGPILSLNDVDWVPSGKHAWAPGIVERDGMFYFYYSVGPKPSHIGVAYSDSPTGPFQDSGQPLLSDHGDPGFEAIDAMVFRDPESGRYFLYAGGSAGSRLRVFELNQDMVSFRRELSTDNPHNFTEGAFMHYRDGTYYMSYSHGYWGDGSYSVHYSTSHSPRGPWTYQGAILVSDENHAGPGHHSFLLNQATQQWYIFYHRWDAANPNTRSVAIEEIHYDQNGRILPITMTDTGVGPVWLRDTLLADFTKSGTVDVQDLMYLAGAWLTDDQKADIHPVGGNGIVDLRDFTMFATQWLQMRK